jgi:hypothetical protein
MPSLFKLSYRIVLVILIYLSQNYAIGEPVTGNRFTATQIAELVTQDPVRFNRLYGSKTLRITGDIGYIGTKFLTLKAGPNIRGWDVYLTNPDVLTELDKGERIEVSCPIFNDLLSGISSNCDNDAAEIYLDGKPMLHR